MKLAIPVMSNNGFDAEVSEHFGHAPYFAFVELEGDTVLGVEIERNPFESHGPGQIPGYIHQKGANILIARGIGARAIDFFHNFGIEVITGAFGTVKDLVEAYVSGSLMSSHYEPKEKFHNH
ncbi:NifB/NifX family molybdenum-iron cluster-binding protein [Kosmotoga pacifica]|uniref:Dinitrogenase iron-molybdenum cofactor biosynthesis protein n=1 Tax=Kosmotoga pacifica TaxID=1330330 RepID=A0A0G2Z833_9BACT|nr:NifB/NifX family molybdenum-iron cluster-binding protein [Kosmotoga pacifica]AKI97727.1 dinitrogenase iron-molybdenum cofactor biosynthesis protein [Kosmotoga pacifica]